MPRLGYFKSKDWWIETGGQRQVDKDGRKNADTKILTLELGRERTARAHLLRFAQDIKSRHR
jgi:hypothetical protein